MNVSPLAALDLCLHRKHRLSHEQDIYVTDNIDQCKLILSSVLKGNASQIQDPEASSAVLRDDNHFRSIYFH